MLQAKVAKQSQFHGVMENEIVNWFCASLN